MRGRMVAAVTVVTAFAVQPALAQAEVIPMVECAEPSTDGRLTGYFGYNNTSDTAVTLAAGTIQNFFLPVPTDRGQPSTFEPGVHPHLFAVTIPFGSQAQWTLGSNRTVLNGSTRRCSRLTWAGAWELPFAAAYGDVVVHDEASWVAIAATTDEPGLGESWVQLGSLRGGPKGDPGPQGPQGPPGPAGSDSTFPSPETWTFSHRGRVLIDDPHVEPDSVIMVQYVGRAGRPTSVASVRHGSFTAYGSRGRSFRYVVYNQP